jgi:hypothetical protein
MKKVALLILLFSCSRGRAENIDLYVMAGQSNIFGIVTIDNDLPAELQAPQDIPFKFSLRYVPTKNFISDGFIDLQPLSNFGSTYFLSTFASELTFGQILQQRSATKIAILKVAANGSSLAVDWDPADPTSMYQRLTMTTDEALVELAGLGYQPTVKGLVWVQGETDSENQTRAQKYANNLDGFINALRTQDWFPSEVPMVINQLHAATNTTYAATVRNAQSSVALGRTDNIQLLNIDDLSLYADGIHYTNAMQLEVGRRLANVFLPAVPEPSLMELLPAALCVLSVCGRHKQTA